MRPSTPANAVFPDVCSASCSGLRWSTSASARRVRSSPRQSSTVTPRLSWTAPRFASRGTSGAMSRTSKVGSTSGRSSSTLHDPRPMASRCACAARASRRLISRACSVPPVMHDTRSGAPTGRPRKPRARVDPVEVDLRQCPVDEAPAVEAGVDTLGRHVLADVDAQVLVLARRRPRAGVRLRDRASGCVQQHGSPGPRNP